MATGVISFTRWWFLIFFIYFHPENWGRCPIWRAYFSDGLVQPPTREFLRVKGPVCWEVSKIKPIDSLHEAMKKRSRGDQNWSKNLLSWRSPTFTNLWVRISVTFSLTHPQQQKSPGEWPGRVFFWRDYQKGGYQQRGYYQERQYGHGRGRWRDREDPRLRRDDSIERRYNAPPSATSINATAFILCLSLYVRNIIEPIKEELQNLECFVKFSKWLSWLFRHGKSSLHTSLSLTLSELFHFREFMQHTNSCL